MGFKTLRNLLQSAPAKSPPEDCRSRKVVFVAHCILNQNARAEGAAEYPSALESLVTGLLERQLGIVQMPCPELLILGLERGEGNIRIRMTEKEARDQCRMLAINLVDQIEQYQASGTSVLGIIGKDGSPTCGVRYLERGLIPAQGVFIEELKRELRNRKIDLPIAGAQDRDPLAVLAVVDKWIVSRATNPGSNH